MSATQDSIDTKSEMGEVKPCEFCTDRIALQGKTGQHIQKTTQRSVLFCVPCCRECELYFDVEIDRYQITL